MIEVSLWSGEGRSTTLPLKPVEANGQGCTVRIRGVDTHRAFLGWPGPPEWMARCTLFIKAPIATKASVGGDT
jgi:hypothetical protein